MTWQRYGMTREDWLRLAYPRWPWVGAWAANPWLEPLTFVDVSLEAWSRAAGCWRPAIVQVHAEPQPVLIGALELSPIGPRIEEAVLERRVILLEGLEARAVVYQKKGDTRVDEALGWYAHAWKLFGFMFYEMCARAEYRRGQEQLSRVRAMMLRWHR